MCPSAGRLQGRRVADEEHGSFKWQCGYIAQHVQRQVCVRALEGRWVEGRRFGWLGLNDAVVFFLFLFFWHFIVFSFSFALSALCTLTSVLTPLKSHLFPPTLSSVRLPSFVSLCLVSLGLRGKELSESLFLSSFSYPTFRLRWRLLFISHSCSLSDLAYFPPVLSWL